MNLKSLKYFSNDLVSQYRYTSDFTILSFQKFEVIFEDNNVKLYDFNTFSSAISDNVKKIVDVPTKYSFFAKTTGNAFILTFQVILLFQGPKLANTEWVKMVTWLSGVLPLFIRFIRLLKI